MMTIQSIIGDSCSSRHSAALGIVLELSGVNRTALPCPGAFMPRSCSQGCGTSISIPDLIAQQTARADACFQMKLFILWGTQCATGAQASGVNSNACLHLRLQNHSCSMRMGKSLSAKHDDLLSRLRGGPMFPTLRGSMRSHEHPPYR